MKALEVLSGPGLYEVSRSFPAAPSSPAAARHFVVAALRSWGVEGGTVDDAHLIVSELATNAVLHAGSSFQLRARIEHERLRVSVRDRSLERPMLLAVDPGALRGRGMQVVAALADQWGVEVSDGGKTVWTTLAG